MYCLLFLATDSLIQKKEKNNVCNWHYSFFLLNRVDKLTKNYEKKRESTFECVTLDGVTPFEWWTLLKYTLYFNFPL